MDETIVQRKSYTTEPQLDWRIRGRKVTVFDVTKSHPRWRLQLIVVPISRLLSPAVWAAFLF